MKIKLLFLTMVTLFSMTSVFASFPVERNVTTVNQTASITTEVVEEFTTPAAVGSYNKWIAVALLVFLGGLAAHRWYAGKPIGWNILFILTLGGFGIWALVDLINILTDNFQ